jgi:hypothetical protein
VTHCDKPVDVARVEHITCACQVPVQGDVVITTMAGLQQQAGTCMMHGWPCAEYCIAMRVPANFAKKICSSQVLQPNYDMHMQSIDLQVLLLRHQRQSVH